MTHYSIPSYISVTPKWVDELEEMSKPPMYTITTGSTSDPLGSSAGTTYIPYNIDQMFNIVLPPPVWPVKDPSPVIDAFIVLGNRPSDKLKEVTEV